MSWGTSIPRYRDNVISEDINKCKRCEHSRINPVRHKISDNDPYCKFDGIDSNYPMPEIGCLSYEVKEPFK